MAHSLNENIKALRIVHGMNQIQFGRLIGVTKQCVSNWENDNVLPSIDMLIKIADAFNVKTDYLLGRDDSKSIDASGLTDDQMGYISLLINEFKRLNTSE